MSRIWWRGDLLAVCIESAVAFNSDLEGNLRQMATLYEDEYCKLTDNGYLVVHRTFELLNGSRKFKIENIECITTGQKLKLGRMKYKGWGMGLSPIIWARDMRRDPLNPNRDQIGRRSVVFKRRDTFLRIGFTCNDVEKLFSEVERISPGVTEASEPLLDLHRCDSQRIPCGINSARLFSS